MRTALIAAVMLGSCAVMVGGWGAGEPGEPAPAPRTVPAGVGGAEQPRARGEFAYWWHVTGKAAGQVRWPGGEYRSDVAVIYEHDGGLYPRVYQGKEENGGLPQRADLRAHLSELERDIQRDIPDPNFSGWAVLDYESWDPVWELTKKEYRERSVALVKRSDPRWSDADAERLAKANYESGAKRFMLETIRKAKAVRPRAKWGYYALPWPTYERFEDRMKWLWEASDALYPCLYTDIPGLPPSDSAFPKGKRSLTAYVTDMRNRVELSRRLGGGKPVVAFLWVRYDHTGLFGGEFVNDGDLEAMLRVPRQAGADGAILWNQAQSAQEAADLNGFVGERLLPMVKRVGERAR